MELGHDFDNNTVVHPTATVDVGAELGPNVVIGPGCHIEAGSRIVNSAIMKGSVVRKGAMINCTILGWNAVVGAFSRLENSVVSNNVEFEEQTLFIESKIGPFRTISGQYIDKIVL